MSSREFKSLLHRAFYHAYRRFYICKCNNEREVILC